jgi:hypothetical protein
MSLFFGNEANSLSDDAPHWKWKFSRALSHRQIQVSDERINDSDCRLNSRTATVAGACASSFTKGPSGQRRDISNDLLNISHSCSWLHHNGEEKPNDLAMTLIMDSGMNSIAVQMSPCCCPASQLPQQHDIFRLLNLCTNAFCSSCFLSRFAVCSHDSSLLLS